MRAQIVSESTNFQRGGDPKAYMGVGGVILQDVYDATVRKAEQEFKDFLDSFIGKKISYVDADSGKRETMVVHSVGQSFMHSSDVWFFDATTEPHVRRDPDFEERIYIIDEST
jgi:hypothetical protein